MNFRKSLSCVKLRLARYIICVFSAPSLAISRISAITWSLSLLPFKIVVVNVVPLVNRRYLYTGALYWCSILALYMLYLNKIFYQAKNEQIRFRFW